MAASKTDIFNMALTMLGAQIVVSPTDGSKNAKSLLAVYDMIRQGELRKSPNWNFSVKTAQLPASGVTPLFDRAFSYPVPNDFLALSGPYPESNYSDRDWIIQGGQIYTNYTAPLNIRYVSDVTDTGLFDPLFATSLAAKLAETVCDALTQSNSKIQIANQRYKEAMAEARKANSFDNVAVDMPSDYWLDVRT